MIIKDSVGCSNDMMSPYEKPYINFIFARNSNGLLKMNVMIPADVSKMVVDIPTDLPKGPLASQQTFSKGPQH